MLCPKNLTHIILGPILIHNYTPGIKPCTIFNFMTMFYIKLMHTIQMWHHVLEYVILYFHVLNHEIQESTQID